MKWYGDIVLKAIEKRKDAFLYAVGGHAQNQMALNAPFKEGVLKNSVNYKIYYGKWSGFESKYGAPAPDHAAMDTPKKDYVRIGSALVYAGAQEKNTGYVSNTEDAMRADGSIMQLAERILKL
jgi:hypothetical protein